ncbi:hypothetical protein CHS0354_025516 [Potamilus streckersoni]|uniref:Uncharacterized protein n=1 Tax=Potamilus streckersoni TaxID=2493646 RepID=A0AAE0VXI4_9BIVA|nr:hypothetical protein CHS0354_025516 [Potamilus streckersoni]
MGQCLHNNRSFQIPLNVPHFEKSLNRPHLLPLAIVVTRNQATETSGKKSSSKDVPKVEVGLFIGVSTIDAKTEMNALSLLATSFLQTISVQFEIALVYFVVTDKSSRTSYANRRKPYRNTPPLKILDLIDNSTSKQ